ncbi:carbohydrate ABC transporter permease [Paenibacillus illinoisensis]|uniref:carbohydrate ABC transporter permease n=1 Tax=Paenibacillus illinoisensis TaxID=59845 RepID=UPI003CFA0A93
MTYKRSSGETVFLWFNVTFMLLLCFATLYPFIYILLASISDPTEISRFRGMLLYPKGFSLDAYAAVLQNPMVLTGYRNTLFYVITGTAINLVMTTLGAYALSRRNVYFRNHIMLFIVITMVFSGGLIPSFLLINNLGMLNTPWALLLPGAINSFNLIIMRTAFQTIPASLEESARIDGANDWVIMTRIIIPLSMPVIAVMILWYAVGHWNSYFNALIYIRDRELFPLQLVLREILISNSTDNMMTGAATSDRMDIGITIKYATIIVSTLPILVLYPFLQKYFVHGVMIGALKE